MNMIQKFARWLYRKSMPSALQGHQWSGTSYIDAYKRNRNPTPNELMAELKGTAWTCASGNAAMCASYPPRLYITTGKNQSQPKCKTKAVQPHVLPYLRKARHLLRYTTASARIEEVIEHPILDILSQVNPVHNGFDLWELTQLYQEVHGAAYWYLDPDGLKRPQEIWILPTQNVTPTRFPNSKNIVDVYRYRSGTHTQDFLPEEIIRFAYPDPRDPYLGALSPLRAAFEQVSLTSSYSAFKEAKFENRAMPDAIVSPSEVIGEEERDRFESQWNTKFRRGGAGKVVVAESNMNVKLINQSMGDLAALAEQGATKEDIANAFHYPLSFLTKETNLANLQAATQLYMSLAISPRLIRRDQKLNEQLIPLYDPSRRLFLASEDPVPLNWQVAVQEKEMYLKYGVYTINMILVEQGLDPVPWGNVPWLPLNLKPTDNHVAVQQIITETNETTGETTTRVRNRT